MSEVHDPPEYEAHDFQRTIPSDGRWCQRCGLAEARWVGEPCIGRITPEFFEAELVEVRSRLADTEGRFRAEREMADLIGLGSRANLERAEAAEARVAALTEALRATTGWLDEWWADPDNPPAAPRQWRTLLSEEVSG